MICLLSEIRFVVERFAVVQLSPVRSKIPIIGSSLSYPYFIEIQTRAGRNAPKVEEYASFSNNTIHVSFSVSGGRSIA